MIHNPHQRVEKMLRQIASYDPQCEVKHLPLSKAFKGFNRTTRLYCGATVVHVRGRMIPRGVLRREGFAPWYIYSDRIGIVLGRGHTLERCVMAALKHLRSGKWIPR